MIWQYFIASVWRKTPEAEPKRYLFRVVYLYLWYKAKTNTIFSNMNLCCFTCWLREHIFMSWFVIFNFHQRNNEKCENYNQSGPKMWHWTIPPLNSHFLKSETQQASFLSGKYEPSEGIVSSHILDDWLL